jgi:hypothetical protein
MFRVGRACSWLWCRLCFIRGECLTKRHVVSLSSCSHRLFYRLILLNWIGNLAHCIDAVVIKVESVLYHCCFYVPLYFFFTFPTFLNIKHLSHLISWFFYIWFPKSRLRRFFSKMSWSILLLLFLISLIEDKRNAAWRFYYRSRFRKPDIINILFLQLIHINLSFFYRVY